MSEDIEESQDFSIILHKYENSAALVIKLSQNNSYLGMVSNKGFRVYSIKEMGKLIVREGDNFELYKEKEGFIKDMEFMGDSLNIILSIQDRGIVVWDENIRKVTASYDFCVPDFVGYCYPYIMAVVDHSILVFNQSMETLCKLIIDPTPLNQNPKVLPQDHHRQRYNYFVHNHDAENLVFSYICEGVLMIENFTRETIVGLELAGLTQAQNDRIIGIQEIQINLIDRQIEKQELSTNYQVKPTPSVYVQLSENLLAISKYESPQTIKIYAIDWMEGKMTLLREFFRGKSPKEISIAFGPRGLIALLSYESLYTHQNTDATLHLFYASSDQKGQTSNRRYYFKTQTQLNKPHDRLMDNQLLFLDDQTFCIASSNNFIVTQRFDMSNQQLVQELIKDQFKLTWQNELEQS